MASPFLAEIRIFAGNFAPVGWAVCNGQILPISQNTALFSLLGTQYGGNGTSNFALPNLQGMVPMHAGSGPGLTPRVQGEVGGSPTVTVLSNQVPQHNHTYNAGSGGRGGTVNTVANNVNCEAPALTNIYGGSTDGTKMSPLMLQSTPGSLPHENRQPYQVLTFIIAMQGIFPSRS
jgi:microcystin-dependent protein